MDYETGYQHGWEDAMLESRSEPQPDLKNDPYIVVWIDRATGGFRWSRRNAGAADFEELMDGLTDAGDTLEDDYAGDEDDDEDS